MTEHTGALKGLKVVDLTRALAGPFCTMLLADQGAEVLKIESIDHGDTTRNMAPFPPEAESRKPYGGYFHSVNRNKQSIAVDLRTEEGRDIVRRLARDADVLVENFRAGVMDSMGLSYEHLQAQNPRLVYAAVRGFGDPRTGESPYAQWPAFDVIAQAMGGMMSITGPDGGEPTKVGPGVGDIIPATLAALGIVSAVRHADQTGEGQFVDVAMYDAIMSFCERIIPQHSFTGDVPGPEGNHHPLLCPFGTFPAADGHVAIACPGDNFWKILCEAMGRPELITDDRFRKNYFRVENKAATLALISDWTQQHTRQALTDMLGGKIPFGPVQDVADLFNDPHVAAREMLAEVDQPGIERKVMIPGTPIKMTRTPGGVFERAPYLGEHSRAILAAAGYTEQEITTLLAGNVVQEHNEENP